MFFWILIVSKWHFNMFTSAMDSILVSFKKAFRKNAPMQC